MEFAAKSNPFLASLLEKLKCSIAFTTYKSGCVVFISSKNGKIRQLTRGFKRPMGIAIGDNKLALATLDETILFSKEEKLANNYPNAPQTYEALYMPRVSYYTGQLDLHDLSFGLNNEIYSVNTRFSCISTTSSKYSFEPFWKPPFISELVPEDRCHLNGMELLNGVPKYVTALSKTNEKGGWRENIINGGILMDVEKNEIILEGLAMPHSPRIINNELYVLLSASGEIAKVDIDKNSYQVVAKFPGVLRGMCEYGDYVFIGISKPRKESATFKKLPNNLKVQEAGIVVFYKPTWSQVGEIKYKNTIDEIYDVKIIPKLQRGNILNNKGLNSNSIVAPGLSYWKKTK